MGELADEAWLSISALARLRGVRKSAISKRVARLEQEGLVNPRPGPLNSKEINVAEFERACAQATDEIRAQNGRAAAPIHEAKRRRRAADPQPLASSDMDGEKNSPVLAREQAKRVAADAELKRMDLEERRGRIISADHAERFVDTCSANAQTVLWRLPGLVEEIIAIGTKEGVPAARTFVKSHVRAAIAEVGALVRMIAERGDTARMEAPDADG